MGGQENTTLDVLAAALTKPDRLEASKMTSTQQNGSCISFPFIDGLDWWIGDLKPWFL